MKRNRMYQREYEQLISMLSKLNIEELMLLFIEAKTGNEQDIDKLPVELLEGLEQIGDLLNDIYADRLLDSLFTECLDE